MRIVGGIWRGRPLEAPDGRGVTRPTTDRVREALASMVLSAMDLDLAGASVLDAFAGSGALGLELLSRGAAHATFCDQDRGAQARVRRNVASMGAASSQVSVVAGDVMRLAQGRLPGAPFDVVLLDPPYATDAGVVSDLVRSLHGSGSLAPGAVVGYERASSAPSLDSDVGRLLKQKRYGQTAVDLLRIGERA
ncbi:MAG: 16S rRNA (guanine(966)-N(2))-methyltransferase RsmD [Atopobiaceae bacterium]|nr:16S rRNA (guanine(966)-N(2))-methyltransferase RsmD [Atopobiaceae bacterium]MCH4180636.1 16S rRNA (guanine(966)-N(2))-methyltransferase RsmD [Atopobiaceae bacterium]MCH4215094.1 16S rRNA (guanine(966)-N(2))-methyltransferase RsmD [Atopobiaceae bacterium]MCH4230326.1 16S rRNA (guanine(966)-N(2))-methyltransferase RsmD [Atopobiaceae bacterium]MCH4277260.1 16S rRNA (guanine(966)-N(2))-methyltransferase RsmD [Atopobiaceae bacterium]